MSGPNLKDPQDLFHNPLKRQAFMPPYIFEVPPDGSDTDVE